MKKLFTQKQPLIAQIQTVSKDAEQRKYGVGLFNMLNLEMARGIIEAAEQENSPVILGVAEVHLPFIPFDYAQIIMNKIARDAQFIYLIKILFHIKEQ